MAIFVHHVCVVTAVHALPARLRLIRIDQCAAFLQHCSYDVSGDLVNVQINPGF